MSNKVNPSYTYKEVAEAAGVSVSAVKMWFKRSGWDFHDIGNVARFIAGHLALRRGK